MSAHLELDFNDDGTVTLTHRVSKTATETSKSAFPALGSGHVAGVRIAAGESHVVTHTILIGTKLTMDDVQDQFSIDILGNSVSIFTARM